MQHHEEEVMQQVHCLTHEDITILKTQELLYIYINDIM